MTELFLCPPVKTQLCSLCIRIEFSGEFAMALTSLTLLSTSLIIGASLVMSAGNSRADDASKTEDSGTMIRANPEMQAVIKKLKELGPKPLGSVPAVEARKQPSPADAVAALLKSQGKDPEKMKKDMGVTTQDLTYLGAAGDQIAARIYKPDAAPTGELPLIFYIHGGGWVIADLDTYDASPRSLAQKSKAIVVSVHYRQAPEHKFPASHDDTLAAYKWMLANAKSWGGDIHHIAIVGESAGGNMAITTAIAARDQKLQMPVHIVAVYPVAGTDLTTPSYKTNEKALPLGKKGMAWFFENEITNKADLKDPRLNLVESKALKGLPPVTIITDEIDPLISEGAMLAKKLQAEGVHVKSKNYTGVTHEFFGMAAVVKQADDAQNFAVDELKAAFETKASQN